MATEATDPDGEEESVLPAILRDLGAELEDVAQSLLRYEEGVVARFSMLGSGSVPASDLQRLDLSIQVIDDLRAIAYRLADRLENGQPPARRALSEVARLERIRHRIHGTGRGTEPTAPVIELF